MSGGDFMDKSILTPLMAIKEKCLDCCCGDSKEVKHCTVANCALFPFRMGRNPNRAGVGGGISNLTPNPSTQ